jgi:Ca-activated chloride channel family protein
MEWQHPGWLYLILPLCAAWLLLSLYSRHRRRRAAEAFVAQAMWSRILPADSPARFWVKMLLRETGLVTGLVALAGPRFGTRYEEVIPRGSDLYVLIDVSRSMLAGDVPPSRLSRAKADVAALLNRLEGERVGLIAFAGQAVVKCPLTVDYDAFRRSLDELDPQSAPRGGTAIGDAIRKALEVFSARTDRDQAILLFTDGDDQQSYPLEAAAVAAERHVTIFAIGLGDADHGARVPQGDESKSYLEYQGQQVWSKLNGSLLKEIALKTSGVYVPVGTRAYDLGELYAQNLQGRRGTEAQSRRRMRRADQFQIFLALALFALMADLFTAPYPRAAASQAQGLEPRPGARRSPVGRIADPSHEPRSPVGRIANPSHESHPALPVSTAVLLVACFAGISHGEDPEKAMRDGLQFYRKGDFAKAQDRFAAAREQFDSRDAGKAAIAAFDQACASHRKGDVAPAREWYLKAGLAHDKALAASAHFNLGTLASEEARRLAGEHPETVAPDKRQEILDQLKSAIASFRHSLDLQPDHSGARRDIELVRQWIKYYTDQWRANDRQARRQETDLTTFLEYLIETQRALREALKALPSHAPADAFAELKRLQDELEEEIPPLKEKISAELKPRQSGGGSAPQGSSRELGQGVALLEGWADAAGEKMSSAARLLDDRQAGPAAEDQRAALDKLEQIWEAVIPFHALLAHDVTDQTLIARSLEPASASAATESDDLARLAEMQERTRERTQLLKLKAEAGRAQLEKMPMPGAGQKGHDSSSVKKDARNAGATDPKPPDPQQLKAGYQKAIELAPRAAARMEQAARALKGQRRQAAHPPAVEARKILEEIQKAQPKQDQPEKKEQDQQKKDQDKQKQDQKDQDKKDKEKQERQKDEGQKDQKKKDQEQKKQEEPGKSDQQKQEQKRPQPQVSRDRIEELLRQVRERQQEKRERDRKVTTRIYGRAPVEKDW